MYYKVIKNGKVIDVLDKMIYVKWQEKHQIPVLCSESEAQGFLSSDKNTIWHEPSLYKFPVDKYDTVEICEIDIYEYNKLRVLNLKSPQEIIDEVILELINMEVL